MQIIKNIVNIAFVYALVFSSSLHSQEAESLSTERMSQAQKGMSTSHSRREPPEGATEEEFVEKIQVTGSRIQRIQLEGPLPIRIIDRESIERSGYNSVADILRASTLSSFGGAREQQLSSVSGLAHVNLRGLGAERTLVLLNGKRLAADAINRAVDLNLLPLAAIDRVEIMASGGSAIYGSDALSGVVNIITRQDYSGAEVSFQQSITELGGGEKTSVSLTAGHSDSQFNMTGIFSYRNNQDLMGDERSWTNHKFSIRGSPGSIGKKINGGDGTFVFKPSPDCPEERVDEDGNCKYNYSPFDTTFPQIEQMGVLLELRRFGKRSHSLTSQSQAYIRFLGTRKVTSFQYPPSWGNITFSSSELANTTDLLDTSGEPILTDQEIAMGGELTFRQRLVELGPRLVEITTNAYSVLGGVRGELPFGSSWDWDLSTHYNYIHRSDDRPSGFILIDDLRQAIISGEYWPPGVEGKRGDLSEYLYTPYQRDDSNVFQSELNLTGEVMDLPSGALAMSWGVMFGQESFQTKTDQQTKDKKVLGKGGVSGGGARDRASTYLEFSIPLARFFEWQLAARYDHYSDFGQTFNPQTAFLWSPFDNLKFRGSMGTGFMAPKVQDLYSNETNGSPRFIDYVVCREEKEVCARDSHPILRRGNPNLKEERSVNASLGTSIQVTSEFNISLDSWYVLLEDEVGSNWSAMTQAEAEFGADYVRDHGVDIQREPTTNEITLVNAPWLNLFSKELFGLDFKANWILPTKRGWLSLNLSHSHLFFYKEETFPGLGHKDHLGENGKPAWRNQISMTYSLNQIRHFNFGVRTVGPNDKLFGGELSTYSEVDLSYKHVTSWDGDLALNIYNILGTTPPLDDTNGGQLNTSIYNNLGRYLTLSYRQRF